MQIRSTATPAATPSVSQQRTRPQAVSSDTPVRIQQDNAAADLASSSPRKLLNDQILSSLQQAIGGQSPSLYELDPEDYAPHKVAERILNFVGQALARIEGDTQALMDRMQAARQGVELGFNEAKDILTGLGAWGGTVEDNAEQTYTLIQQGLDGFDQQISSGQPIMQAPQIQSLQQSSVSQQQGISLQVTTREGDSVTLHIDQRQGASESQFTQQLNGRQVQVDSQSLFASSGFSISTEGHISDEEMAAIKALVSQVHGVSNAFFSDDTQAAIAAASDLGYDTAQLAGFSLSLTESTQSRATSAYQTVGHIGDLAKPQLAKPGSPFGQFVRDFAQALGDMQHSPLFATNANESFEKLFANLPRMNEQQQAMVDQLQQRSGKMLEDIASSLINALQPFIDASQN